ncbi:hypothetical protein PT281_02610 [Lactobacillus sp. ESL0701]|uniref:DUF6575 domain-containing protein n=1 Tax=Lactobacillus sp. ESL0701 TaxID=2983217 RepID=UPI0023F77D45|nr:DUF6575 domain-containing protein [Lactobacillus sp. ESL0701]MDF7672180.1 hypothetical protein [Lactobacillus sp. ESL0701]
MEKLNFKPFNKINIFHVYDYYDEPILYSFTTEIGSLFVANFIDYEEKDDTDVWAYLPVSYEELSKLEHKQISLLDLYRNLISEVIYIEKQGESKDVFYAESSKAINPQWLPDKDYYVSYKESLAIDDTTIYDNTYTENRYGLDFSIQPLHDKHEVSVDLLADILLKIQNLLVALTQPKDTKKLLKEYINNKATQLQFVGTYAGSFGTRLLSNGVSSLINDDEALPYEKLVELFQETQSGENIDADFIVKKYGWLVLDHMSKLSKSFKGVETGKITAKIPKPGNKIKIVKSTFTSKSIGTFINKVGELPPNVDEETFEIPGTLTRYDSKSESFSFTTKTNDKKDEIYNGVVKTNAKKFTIPSDGIATIKEIKTSDNLRRVEDKYEYELLSLETNKKAYLE